MKLRGSAFVRERDSDGIFAHGFCCELGAVKPDRHKTQLGTELDDGFAHDLEHDIQAVSLVVAGVMRCYRRVHYPSSGCAAPVRGQALSPLAVINEIWPVDG